MSQLVQAREMAGLTRAQVAKAVGCSRISVLNWETGRALPSSRHVRSYAEVLGLTVSRTLDLIAAEIAARAAEPAASAPSAAAAASDEHPEVG